MNETSIAVLVLLGLALLVEWICLLGLLAMRNPFDRLHAIAPANILPPIFCALAILLANHLSLSSAKAVVIALTLLAAAPLLTHATARAARLRAHGKIAQAEK